MVMRRGSKNSFLYGGAGRRVDLLAGLPLALFWGVPLSPDIDVMTGCNFSTIFSLFLYNVLIKVTGLILMSNTVGKVL